MTTIERVNSNALPESQDYMDDGCEESPSCLSCPLPACVYDTGMGADWLGRAERYARIYELRRQGKSITEVATIFKVAKRTVSRATQKAGTLEHPQVRGGLSIELPKIDPCDLKPHDFKPIKPRLREDGQILFYESACPACTGTVAINNRTREAYCMACSRDPREAPRDTWMPEEELKCAGSGQSPYYPSKHYPHCPECKYRVTVLDGLILPHRKPMKRGMANGTAACSGAGKDPWQAELAIKAGVFHCPDCYRKVSLNKGLVPFHKRQGG